MEQKLDKIRLFSKLTPDEIDKLSNLFKNCHYQAGEFIFKEGEKSDSFHIITSGKVEVFSSANNNLDVELSNAGPGDTIGEVGFVDGKERSASIKCLSSVTTYCLSKSKFNNLIENDPSLAMKILSEIGVILSERLRWCDKILIGDQDIVISSKLLSAIKFSSN